MNQDKQAEKTIVPGYPYKDNGKQRREQLSESSQQKAIPDFLRIGNMALLKGKM